MMSTLECELCGSRDVEVVADRDRNNEPLRNVMCTSCGLVWVDPRPKQDELSEFYAERYRSEYKGAYEPKFKHCWREMHRAISRVDRFREAYHKGGRVLDVGAGAGFFSYVLSKNGVNVEGVEPNKGYSKFARDVLGVSAVRTGYLEDMVGQGTFEVITINHVFEHLSNPFDSLRHMRDLLSAGGRLVIEVPNIFAAYHSPRKVFHVGHLYWFSPATLEALAVKAGFSIKSVIIVPGTEHINMILEKAPLDQALDYHVIYQGNADKVRSFLSSRTVLRHYCSGTPYKRFLGKMSGYFNEWKSVRRFTEKLKLIESIPVAWRD